VSSKAQVEVAAAIEGSGGHGERGSRHAAVGRRTVPGVVGAARHRHTSRVFILSFPDQGSACRRRAGPVSDAAASAHAGRAASGRSPRGARLPHGGGAMPQRHGLFYRR